MDELFESNGFVKLRDEDKLLSILINNKNYDFDYETNTINYIPNTDIAFAIAVDSNGKNYFY